MEVVEMHESVSGAPSGTSADLWELQNWTRQFPHRTSLSIPTDADTSKALVMNVGGHDATLLTAPETGSINALGPLPLPADANAWTVGENRQICDRLD